MTECAGSEQKENSRNWHRQLIGEDSEKEDRICREEKVVIHESDTC